MFKMSIKVAKGNLGEKFVKTSFFRTTKMVVKKKPKIKAKLYNMIIKTNSY